MTPQQVEAIEQLVGRELSGAERTILLPLVACRNDIEIAKVLSEGRTTHGKTAIGTGTIIALLKPLGCGGRFIKAVLELATTDPDVEFGFNPVTRGALDLSVPEARESIAELKDKMSEEFYPAIDRILMVGVIPDPINFNIVSDLLNQLEAA